LKSRKTVSLAAYRHIRRLRQLHLGDIKRSDLPPRPNSILIGPTGCGKTFLVELLFGQILKLPYVIIDMTKFTESGYVGDDVINILVQLVYAANENLVIAECGVVVLDEFDKIAGAFSNTRFAGQGTTKDVSGYGVQRELLKILEGADIQIPLDLGFSNRSPREVISTRDITFFAIGAFSGFKSLYDNEGMGFVQPLESKNRRDYKIAYSLNDKEADDIDKFYGFGFLPELISRFNRIITFQPLSRTTLKEILNQKIQGYKKEFSDEGFKLHIDPRVKDFIVEEAIKRQAGARGLDVLISKYLEEVAFEIFGTDDEGEIVLTIGAGNVSHIVKKKK